MEVEASESQSEGRVVVVDDEPMVREVVSNYLRRAGYEVEAFGDGAAGLRSVRNATPDLVVLDIMLPERNGLSVLQEIRRTSDVPVILLTARGDESDRVGGLELGADDYVTKPFSPREVVARVRSVLRRSQPQEPPEPLDYGRLRIDPLAREATIDGAAVQLTRREFALLHHLASHPRQTFSREDLLRDVWDSSEEWQDPSTVTVHVRRLRKKIEADPDDPHLIETVWGVGYRFEPGDAATTDDDPSGGTGS